MTWGGIACPTVLMLSGRKPFGTREWWYGALSNIRIIFMSGYLDSNVGVNNLFRTQYIKKSSSMVVPHLVLRHIFCSEAHFSSWTRSPHQEGHVTPDQSVTCGWSTRGPG